MRNQYREHDVSSKKSWVAQIVLSAISILDILVCFVVTGQKYNYPWVAAMIRPFYLVISIRVLREYAKRYFLVIKDSTPMVLFIVVYILYFAWMGQRLFSGTLEGVQYFDTFGNSVFKLLFGTVEQQSTCKAIPQGVMSIGISRMLRCALK